MSAVVREGDSGVYVLALKVEEPGLSISVGALGSKRFSAGYYCYVGSAMRGLRCRLERHLRRRRKKVRWHIDYLRQHAAPATVLVWHTTEPAECELSRAVGRIAGGSVDGFGCSDCACRSHLYYFSRDPLGRLRRITAGGAPSCVRPVPPQDR